MADIGWIPVTLPSHGALYVTDAGVALVPDGKVEIRKMTTREEATLLEQGASGTERISILIRQCCKLPEVAVKAGMKPEDLLVSDRMALLLALRAHSLSADYWFNWRCQSCGAQNRNKLNIVQELNETTPETIPRRLMSEGKMTELEAKSYMLKEPVLVKLPDAGAEVGIRFLRGTDEEKLARFTKKMQAQSNAMDSLLVYRLQLQIVSVDGVKLSPREVDEFVRNLTMKDSRTLDLAISDHETGIDLTVFLDCRACQATNEMEMPLTAEFFRPKQL